MIYPHQLEEVAATLEAVLKIIRRPEGLTRTDIGDIRMAVTTALCEINGIERVEVGVPPPKRGD